MDKFIKKIKSDSKDRDSFSNFFADSEMMETDKAIYVDNKNEKVLKFTDDLDSDKDNSASRSK